MIEKFKKGIMLGMVFILISILIGIIFEHDIAFIFAGTGTVIIGISFLYYINNKSEK